MGSVAVDSYGILHPKKAENTFYDNHAIKYCNDYDNLGRLVDESVVTGSKTRSQLQSIYDTTPDNYTYSASASGYAAPPLATGMKLYAPLRRYRYGDLHHASGKVNAIPAALAFLPVPGIVEQSDLSAERDAGLLRYEYALLADSVLYKPALNPALPGGPIELLGSLPSGDIGAIVRPDASPGPCVERAYYYDSKCRVIQKVERDHTGGILRTSLRYDFRGNVLCSRQHYTKADVSDYLTQTFTYDPRGRLLAETSQVNAGTTASVHYTYDDLGRLTGKSYGSGTHAVSETLAYNIQGWRTGQQVKKGSATLFESTLHYYDPVQSATVPSFTGNITEWAWQHGASSDANRYAFTYDRLARLSDSRRYVAGVETTAHSEKGLYYDRNGNLTALKRYGSTGLDGDFTYTYNGNQINTLTDGTTSCAYAYDANGNTKHDGLHNLDIDYNFLNLPWKVQHSKTMKARYSYYADGTKFSVSDASGSSRIYAGNLVYVKRNGVQGLESAAFGGGRFRTSLVIGGVAYIPDYFITDHLGSTRAIIENGQVTAQYNYYPYGGEWSTSSQLVSDDNRYKFSGKEDQTTLGAPIYDFHARSYTSRVPMFLQQDPKATDYYSISPYAYCAGNPVRRIDRDGNKWVDANGNVMWENGKWTKYATQDAITTGIAMRAAPTGLAAFERIANSEGLVQINLSRDIALSSDKTRLIRGELQPIRTREVENSEYTLLEGIITIYVGSIEFELNSVEKSDKIGEMIKKLPDDIAVMGAIGSVATHEEGHMESENLKHQYYELDDDYDIEQRPLEQQMQYLQELLNNK